MVSAIRNFAWLLLPVLALSALPGSSQQPASPPNLPAQPKPDYSQEGLVFEQILTSVRMENDGTDRRELKVRVRAQSQAGVQQLGQLAFEYNTANQSLD